MPFKHGVWFLLALVPLTLVAFWPGYFSDLHNAPLAFHLHGLTAAAWLLTLVGQSWSAARRDFVAHRIWGRISLVVFPVFLAGQLGVIQSMAIKAANGHPLYAQFGARLGMLDLVSAVSLAWLFFQALAGRRTVAVHATAVLATVAFLIPPTLGRIMATIPGVSFPAGVQIGQCISLAVMLGIWRERGSDRTIATVVGLILIVQSILFETLGRTEAWSRAYSSLAGISPSLCYGTGLAAGLAVTIAGWCAVHPARNARTA